MKITNKISDRFTTSFLEAMIEWCRKEVDLPKWWLKAARFKYLPHGSRYEYRGVSYNCRKKISVSLGRYNSYPLTEKSFRRFEITINDDIECILTVTAHELLHQYQDYHNIYKDIEFGASAAETRVLKKFQENKNALLEEWRSGSVVVIGMRSRKPLHYQDLTLTELIISHISTGGDAEITVEELLKTYYC